MNPSASTLSAEACPFVPRNFVPSSTPASSEPSIPCTSATGPGFYSAEVPGYYSSLVPTPALPFYAVQYPCTYPPQTDVYPDNNGPADIRPTRSAAPRQGRGRWHKDRNTQRGARGTDDKQPARNSREERLPVSETRYQPGLRNQRSNEWHTATAITSSPSANPDLTNCTEFPSLSPSEPERLPTVVAKESFSYSSALKQQPQKPAVQTVIAPIDTKSCVERETPVNHPEASDGRKTPKNQRARKNVHNAENVRACFPRRDKVQTNRISSSKSARQCSETPVISKDCLEPQDCIKSEVKQCSREKQQKEPLVCRPLLVSPAADDSLWRESTQVDVPVTPKPEHSYAAALHSTPAVVENYGADGKECGVGKDFKVKTKNLPAFKGERSKAVHEGTNPCNSSKILRRVGSSGKAQGQTPGGVGAPKLAQPVSLKVCPQVRINVSKAKKETHNSALKRNIIKSQQKNAKGETEVKSAGDRKTSKKRKKKSPKVPDLMVTKVGVISQEFLDFIHGDGGGGVVAKVENDEPSRLVEEYPPLEGDQELLEQNASFVQLRTYSKIVASKAAKKVAPAVAQQPAALQKYADATKKRQEKSADKKPQNTRLQKLVALGNAPTPLHKEPISMHISSIIISKEKQSKKLKGKENLFSGGSKKEIQVVKGSANILDSSAPPRKRGKERELPRKKKLTVMKRIILKEREQRKQLLEKMKQAATSRQQLIESSAVLEEHVVEDASTPANQQKYSLHSKNFREYCDHLLSKEINDVSKKLIEDLVLFQDRLYLKDPVKARSKRRLVYGLKEVKRYLSLNKLKCIIFAPDIEEVKAEGGLNDSLQDLIISAKSHSVPVVFALKRRALGYHTKKSVPVSCIGIFDYSGREADFRHLMELVDEAKKAYNYALQQLEDKQKAAEGDSLPGPTLRRHQTDSAMHQNPGEVRTIEPFSASETVSAGADDGWITSNDTDEESADEADGDEARAAKVSKLLVDILREPQK